MADRGTGREARRHGRPRLLAASGLGSHGPGPIGAGVPTAGSSLSGTATLGLFGKLPAHGDFIRRGLPGGFVDPWDAWLSAGLLAAADGLGDAWPEAWARALPFAFHLLPGACGAEAAAGVVLPSVDMVGRRFPLTLAAITPDAGMPDGAWLTSLATLGQAAMAEGLDADALLLSLPPPPLADPDATLDGLCHFWGGAGPGVNAAGLPLPAALAGLMGLSP